MRSLNEVVGYCPPDLFVKMKALAERRLACGAMIGVLPKEPEPGPMCLRQPAAQGSDDARLAVGRLGTRSPLGAMPIR
jgi:hypothetical protein